MRLLIIIGAGASHDCWRPEHIHINKDHMPVAKDLFSVVEDPQEKLLNKYQLGGLADELNEIVEKADNSLDIEAELEKINNLAVKNKDTDTLLGLFNARFYLQNLIYDYQLRTLRITLGRTAYVTMLRKLKRWILENPEERFVDIISFNYDSLLEEAMTHVYGHAWGLKVSSSPLNAYYQGSNLRIYKPHGSITWGRKIQTAEGHKQLYTKSHDLHNSYDKLKFTDEFVNVEPSNLDSDSNVSKYYIPAIAVPFKTKNNFDECPPEMISKMKVALGSADQLITFGWKGGDSHLVELMRKNKNLTEVHVVSPDGDTELGDWLPIVEHNIGFCSFVNQIDESNGLDRFLNLLKG